MQELLRWYGEGRLKPHISKTFPLAQGAEAIRHVMDRKAMGKVVLTV
jgi:NADPH2:quinone reductase